MNSSSLLYHFEYVVDVGSYLGSRCAYDDDHDDDHDDDDDDDDDDDERKRRDKSDPSALFFLLLSLLRLIHFFILPLALPVYA